MRELLRYSLVFLLVSNIAYAGPRQDLAKQLSSVEHKVERQKRKHYTAYTRQGNRVSDKESAVIGHRFPRIKAAVEQAVGTTVADHDVPMISLICSGGGLRAMISSLGFMEGAESIGLLDASAYMSGVSGSAWMMATWLAHNCSPKEFSKTLKKQVKAGLMGPNWELSELAKLLWEKKCNDQSTSLADIWGYILGKAFFEDIPNGDHLRLSDLQKVIAKGAYPYPLLNTILANDRPYEWVEFSPYEAGGFALGAWVPTDAVGKKFSNGVTYDTAPELSLSNMLGVIGSAYSIDAYDALVHIKDSILAMFRKKDKKGFFSNPFDFLGDIFDTRISPAEVYGFTYGMPNARFNNLEEYTLVDAGIDFNLGFSPTLHRGAELIVVCDASDDSDEENVARAIERAEQHAKRKGLKFPRINPKGIGARDVTAFYDEHDPEVPVVLYFPNKIDVTTLKFQYDEKEYDQVHDSMRSAVIRQRNVVYAGIQRAIENKRLRRQMGKKMLKDSSVVVVR